MEVSDTEKNILVEPSEESDSEPTEVEVNPPKVKDKKIKVRKTDDPEYYRNYYKSKVSDKRKKERIEKKILESSSNINILDILKLIKDDKTIKLIKEYVNTM